MLVSQAVMRARYERDVDRQVEIGLVGQMVRLFFAIRTLRTSPRFGGWRNLRELTWTITVPWRA